MWQVFLIHGNESKRLIVSLRFRDEDVQLHPHNLLKYDA